MKYIPLIMVIAIFSGCGIRDNGQPSESDIRTLVVLDLGESLKSIDLKYRSLLRNGFYCWISGCDKAGDKYLLTVEVEFNGLKYQDYVIMTGSDGGYNGNLTARGKDDAGALLCIDVPIKADYKRYELYFGKERTK